MSYTHTSSESTTFTIVHARHIAAKVATDLKRIQRFYGYPSDGLISDFENEVIELLRYGYLSKVTYGFKKDGQWIEPTLVFLASELQSDINDDPGKIRPGRNVAGSDFYSFLEYSSKYHQLSEVEKESFHKGLAVSRTTAATPTINGYLEEDRNYCSGGRSLTRSSVRGYV